MIIFVVAFLAMIGIGVVAFAAIALLAVLLVRIAWHAVRLAFGVRRDAAAPFGRRERQGPPAAPPTLPVPLPSRLPARDALAELAYWRSHVRRTTIALLLLALVWGVSWGHLAEFPPLAAAVYVLMVLVPAIPLFHAALFVWWLVAVGSWAKWRRISGRGSPRDGVRSLDGMA